MRDALHTIDLDTFPLPTELTRERMLHLYTDRLASKRRASEQARAIYKLIRSSGPDKLCAYCRSSPARQLDHFMPKHDFYAIAVEPWNLVPCCNTCNLRMLARWERNSEKRMMHPYFMPRLGRWLKARIDIGDPDNDIEPIAVYTAEPDEAMIGEELSNRVREQFDTMDLASTLADATTTHLESAKWTVQLSALGTRESGRAELRYQAKTHLVRDINHPIGVLFEALANDDRFIDYYLTKQIDPAVLEIMNSLT